MTMKTNGKLVVIAIITMVVLTAIVSGILFFWVNSLEEAKIAFIDTYTQIPEKLCVEDTVARVEAGLVPCALTIAEEEAMTEYVEVIEEIKEPQYIPPAPQQPKEIELSSRGEDTSIFVITGYCPCSKCCGKWANGITSTGVIATPNHTIAVDPKVIPYGTKVEICGQIYVAEDCGGAIKGNKIDMYFATHEEALQWGRQRHEIRIIK